MKMKIILTALSFSLISSFAHANPDTDFISEVRKTAPTSQEEMRPHHREAPPEVRAAFKACHESNSNITDRTQHKEAMGKCLKEKGIEPPKHKHPPMSEKDRAIHKECLTTVPKTPEGNPDKKFMKKCWEEKGGSPMPMKREKKD